MSFPYHAKKELKKYFKEKKIYLGDIAISYEYIFIKKNKCLSNQKVLIKTFIHGFLHLLGFDHNKIKETRNSGNQVLDGMTNWEGSATSDGERFSSESENPNAEKRLENYNIYLKRKAARAESKKRSKQKKIVQSHNCKQQEKELLDGLQ